MLKSLTIKFSQFAAIFIILVQTIAYPATIFAQSDTTVVDPATTTTQPVQQPDPSPVPDATASVPVVAPTVTETKPAVTNSGPTQPQGPDAKTYHKNPDGTWSNDYFTWNPVTGLTKPIQEQTYSYNPSTGHWDTVKWVYAPESNKYISNIVSVTVPPSGAATTSQPQKSGSSISNTGPNSNNTINNNNQSNSNFDLFYDAKISNNINQLSTTGNAIVQGNTLGGSATTGNADNITNLINLLQSSWGALGSHNISTFVANIDGNVTGDLYVDPSALTNTIGNGNTKINEVQSGLIQNNINSTANSGDASVSGNTTAGNATSGNANAVVNLLNLINSTITSSKSFIGVLNINGNFNGDILLPKGQISSVIASSGPNSNNTIDNSNSHNLNVAVDDSKTINNTVNSNAVTGNASVDHNTTGGSATSGSASNVITMLNLTGQHVVSKDSILVFVNVLGDWVGLILNAPAGSTSVAATGPNSNNQITNNTSNNLDINLSSNNTIENNINVAAKSGDATVSNNTKAGDAKSGDANTSVNIANLIDSSFQASDWFGVLFINVYGSWLGSFGVNTSAGDVTATSATNHSNNSQSIEAASTLAATTTSSSSARSVFSFSPTTHHSNNQTPKTGGIVSDLASKIENPIISAPSKVIKKSSNMATIILFTVSIGVSLLMLERYMSLSRR